MTNRAVWLSSKSHTLKLKSLWHVHQLDFSLQLCVQFCSTTKFSCERSTEKWIRNLEVAYLPRKWANKVPLLPYDLPTDLYSRSSINDTTSFTRQDYEFAVIIQRVLKPAMDWNRQIEPRKEQDVMMEWEMSYPGWSCGRSHDSYLKNPNNAELLWVYNTKVSTLILSWIPMAQVLQAGLDEFYRNREMSPFDFFGEWNLLH